MTTATADQAYADYMLHWVQTLEWPSLPVAEQTLPQIQAWWRDRAATDLDAVADRLWAWVDANGGQAHSSDQRMILARMLICLASPSNRELQQRGYFEELLDLYGVAPEDILRVMDERQIDTAGSSVQRAGSPAEGSVDPAASARSAYLRQMKMRVVWAFLGVSFLSGIWPLTLVPEPSTEAIVLGWISVLLVYLGYRLDAEERGFQRTPWMNVAIILFAGIAVPYYLIRSRGLEQGRRAIGKAIVILFLAAVMVSLGFALFGEPIPIVDQLPAEAPSEQS
ncbi:MAG: hypothetical protein AB7E72_06195 [Lysobacterales bacterium]